MPSTAPDPAPPRPARAIARRDDSKESALPAMHPADAGQVRRALGRSRHADAELPAAVQGHGCASAKPTGQRFLCASAAAAAATASPATAAATYFTAAATATDAADERHAVPGNAAQHAGPAAVGRHQRFADDARRSAAIESFPPSAFTIYSLRLSYISFSIYLGVLQIVQGYLTKGELDRCLGYGLHLYQTVYGYFLLIDMSKFF